MLLSPGDCCGGRFVYVVWFLLKALAKPPIVYHEWLVPLVHHLVYFTQ